MWNNKRIKVLTTANIGGISVGDIITVEEQQGNPMRVKILTVNGKPYNYKGMIDHFWSISPERWEILSDEPIWYKNPSWNYPNDYCKGVITGDFIEGREIIRYGKYTKETVKWGAATKCIPATPVEYSQYLPQEHPDKIQSGYVHKPIPDTAFKARVIKDIEFKDDVPSRGTLPSWKKGDITWFTEGYRSQIGTDRSVHPENNRYTSNVRGNCFEIMESVDLLEEAKKRYPAGTEYKCAGNVVSKISTVKSDSSWNINSAKDKVDIGGGGYLYYRGKWAEIINKSIEQGGIKVGDTVFVKEGGTTTDAKRLAGKWITVKGLTYTGVRDFLKEYDLDGVPVRNTGGIYLTEVTKTPESAPLCVIGEAMTHTVEDVVIEITVDKGFDTRVKKIDSVSVDLIQKNTRIYF